MTGSSRGGWLADLGLACLLLTGCAGERPVDNRPPTGPARSVKDNEEERKVVSLLRAGDAQQALRLSDQMIEMDLPSQRQAGAYWKAVSLIYLGRSDSAATWLKLRRGQWGGGLREAYAETLLYTLESKPDPCKDVSNPAGDKGSHARLEAMERRSAELQSEVERLQSEKVRYEKLLHELDHLP